MFLPKTGSAALLDPVSILPPRKTLPGHICIRARWLPPVDGSENCPGSSGCNSSHAMQVWELPRTIINRDGVAFSSVALSIIACVWRGSGCGLHFSSQLPLPYESAASSRAVGCYFRSISPWSGIMPHERLTRSRQTARKGPDRWTDK